MINDKDLIIITDGYLDSELFEMLEAEHTVYGVTYSNSPEMRGLRNWVKSKTGVNMGKQKFYLLKNVTKEEFADWLLLATLTVDCSNIVCYCYWEDFNNARNSVETNTLQEKIDELSKKHNSLLNKQHALAKKHHSWTLFTVKFSDKAIQTKYDELGKKRFKYRRQIDALSRRQNAMLKQEITRLLDERIILNVKEVKAA